MWLGFPINKGIAKHKGKPIKRLPHHGDSSSQIIEFLQSLFPNEWPDAVLGHHISQIPSHEKVTINTGLSYGFYITIYLESGYKDLSRGR